MNGGLRRCTECQRLRKDVVGSPPTCSDCCQASDPPVFGYERSWAAFCRLFGLGIVSSRVRASWACARCGVVPHYEPLLDRKGRIYSWEDLCAECRAAGFTMAAGEVLGPGEESPIESLDRELAELSRPSTAGVPVQGLLFADA